jgi:hypothetical protein
MVIVGFGTTVSADLISANFFMRSLLSADIRTGAEILQLVGFFTRSLRFLRKNFSTEKQISPHFSKKRIKKDSKKGKKEEEN